MRTLVDLLSSDCGYVCVYAELDGYAYEISTYSPLITRDLFASMNGFTSQQDATETAGHVLAAIDPRRRRRKRQR